MEIRFTKIAYDDAQHLSEYLKNESSEVIARTVLTRIYDAITSLTQFPEQGRKGRIPGTRELIIAQLPFIVAYRVQGNELQILTIMHAARRWPTNFSN
jgi:addiction module RelE/StbE family toxin